MNHALDYWSQRHPKCPHCDELFPVWEGDNPLSLNYEDGGQTTFKCRDCGKDFVCVTVVSYEFSTAVSEDAASDEKWGPQEADAA